MTSDPAPPWEEALFSRNPIPMWVYDTDTLAFLEVNAAAEHRYGYTRDEFLSMRVTDIRPPEDIPALLERLSEKPSGVDHAGVWRHLKKDGTGLHVEIVTHPIDFRNRKAGLVVAHDVTAREAANSQLREHVAILESVGFVAQTLLSSADWQGLLPDVLSRLGTAADVSRSYLFTVDSVLDDDVVFTQRFEWAAAHAKPEIENDSMQRMSFREHGFGDWIPSFMAGRPVFGPIGSFSEQTREFLAAQAIRTVLVVPIFVEGTLWGFIGFDECRYERHWTEAHVEALRTAANIIGMGVQRGLLEKQFLQSQKMEVVGFLASGIAHDFNNALAVIFASCDFMSTRLPPNDPVCQDLAEVRRAAERAAALTRQLLSFSRDRRTAPRDIEVNESVQNLSKMMRRLLGEHIEMRLDLSPGAAFVHMDPVQLEHVLVNLAVNARDAMAEGGTLTISTECRASGIDAAEGRGAGSVVIRVTDTGSGVPPEVRNRVFEPFFTTKPAGKGTGLGLAMAHRAVTTAGGRIELESEMGAGTTLTVSLPRRATSDHESSASVSTSRLGQREVVLVVEDDNALREALVRMLREANYDPVAAAHGSEALARLESLRSEVRVLVTDVLMPGMSGVDLARGARARIPKLRILFISGHADEDLDVTGFGADTPPLLRKPFDRRELLARIADLLRD